MRIEIAFLVFVPCALAAFRFARPAVAVLAVFLGGWIVLPVGHYPAGAAGAEFAYWITGLAVPSDMLLTKAWIAPVTALFGALVFDRKRWRGLRPVALDVPIALWCLWPLLQSAFVPEAQPPGWIASLYLAGCWGTPWLLGRVYFAHRDGLLLLAKGLVLSALACLPISLIEGINGALLYGFVYEPHPFRFDGDVRYLGFRPLGFFEHGNQFGLWIALCALAALWLARTPGTPSRRRVIAAAVVTAMALAAQSVGAILMLGLGAGFLSVCAWLRPRRLVMAVAGALVVGGATYVSGVVPITAIGKETALGRRVVEGLRAVGRGSFAWRISQDQKLLPAALVHPVAGSAHWDWWAAYGIRPWSLTILVLGQFGLVGLCLCLVVLLGPALRVAWRSPQASGWQPQALPLLLATLVVLAVFDALMNSFIFFPAIMAAGGLAAAQGDDHAGD